MTVAVSTCCHVPGGTHAVSTPGKRGPSDSTCVLASAGDWSSEIDEKTSASPPPPPPPPVRILSVRQVSASPSKGLGYSGTVVS